MDLQWHFTIPVGGSYKIYIGHPREIEIVARGLGWSDSDPATPHIGISVRSTQDSIRPYNLASYPCQRIDTWSGFYHFHDEGPDGGEYVVFKYQWKCESGYATVTDVEVVKIKDLDITEDLRTQYGVIWQARLQARCEQVLQRNMPCGACVDCECDRWPMKKGVAE